MICPPAVLEASYALCRQVARRAHSSFYPSFVLLRGPKRHAMEALYAFMRHTDDLGDCPRPVDDRRRSLVAWRAALQSALAGREPSSCLEDGDALLPALIDAVRRFQVPEACLFDVIDGVEMDLAGHRYRTFAELADYCHCVASSVGLACIHIWGFRGPDALELARSCGLAFQLTNILRDHKEDSAQGRLYLPLEDLEKCGYSSEDLACGVADERYDRLMAIEIRRARELYRCGVELFDRLEPPGRRIFGMMLSTYWRLLESIAQGPRRALTTRVRLSRWEKMRIAARWTLLPPRKPVLGITGR